MLLRVLILAAACAVAGRVAAQAVATAAAPLTLPDVLQAARAAPDVALSESAWAAARADVLAADHGPAPVLSAKASAIDLQNGIGGGNVLGAKRIDKAVGLDWTLERGNKRLLRTRAAEYGAGAARLDLQEALVQQQLAAASAFYDLLAAQERVAQTEAIEASAAQLAASAQRRLRAGDISQQDVLRIETEAQRMRADLRAAQADRQRAVIALGQLTGRAGPLLAQGDWPALQAPAVAPPDLEGRSDVQAAQQRVQAAQAALDAALALRKNDVTVGASYDHFPGTSKRLLELRVQLPLAGVLGSYGFEGEIARARAGLEQAERQLEKTRRAAAADTSRQWQDLQASAARVRVYDDTILPRARQLAALAEAAYGKGAMALTDLIDARRTLRSVLLEDVAARAEHARALSAWQLRAAAAPSS
jgi:cobalt-zinc-cadmium efflux system outer membrane protein